MAYLLEHGIARLPKTSFEGNICTSAKCELWGIETTSVDFRHGWGDCYPILFEMGILFMCKQALFGSDVLQTYVRFLLSDEYNWKHTVLAFLIISCPCFSSNTAGYL
jgi:hypothetical protein